MNYIWWHILLVVIISYFCGNISFSRIISSVKHDDITKLGSGNPGSTNVLRNYGLKFGVLNLLLDMLKSLIPCLVAFYIFDKSYVYLYIAGVSSMVGHIYPVIFKFRGGKGIATMMGIFFASNPIATIIVLIVGFVIWVLLEYGSVVSFVCVTALSVIEGLRFKQLLDISDRKIISLILFAIFILTWYAHRKNIERLLLGKESKASLIKKSKKSKKKLNSQKKDMEAKNL